jgi:methyl-accepting chemotaxis protein
MTSKNDMSAGSVSAKDGRKGMTLGIGAKLTGAVGAVSLLTVAAIGIAIYAFNDAQREFNNFNEVQIPRVVSAGELATFSTDVTIASSQLINAQEETARATAFDALSSAVGRLVASAEAHGGSADASAAVQALRERAQAFQSNLDELDTLTRDNISLARERDRELAELFQMHDTLAATLAPLVNDAYYSLIFDGEAAAVEASRVIDGILNTDMHVFRRLLTLRIEAGSTAAATSGFLLTEDDAVARTFDDRMIAASDRLRLLVDQLRADNALPAIEAELGLLAEMPATARIMRRDPLFDSGSTAVRRFMSQLLDVGHAVDLALIDAVDDMLFDLTINGENAVAKSTATISELVDNQVTRLKDTLEMISSLREFTALLVQGALTNDPAVIKPLQDRAAGIVWTFESKVRATGSEEAESQIAHLASFADRDGGLIAIRARQLGILNEVTTIVDAVFADTVEINSLISDVVDARRDAIAADSALLENRLQQNGYLLIGLGAAVLLLAVAIGILVINRGVARPLASLIASTRALADGKLDVAVGYDKRRDELGDLSRALAVFRENAIEKVRMERESEGTRAEREAARAERERAKADEARVIQIAVDALGEGLTRLSEGDVSVRIDEPFVDSLESLRLNFNASLSKLADTLASVRDNADAISSASGEMRAGTDDLSRRTEQQAASLEETAAALEEITSTVKNSSGQADHASRLVGAAKEGAEKSRQVVDQAIGAMGRIEAASGQISQIISVIDEIAFQTNLLALNAGVEAARAGEAGRGFAVVAQEVRELAGRAGSAAKEIKDLITRSSVEVGSGVKLVRATGEALNEIEQQVNDINSSVQAIATAAREQSAGLQEINTAVNHMDQMTQQNAAMVEQTTAATHTLAADADALRGLVGQFVIESSLARHRQNRAA